MKPRRLADPLHDRDRDVFAAHASAEAIKSALAAEQAEERRVQRRVSWLQDLLDRRLALIRAGEWPTPVGEPTSEGGSQ